MKKWLLSLMFLTTLGASTEEKGRFSVGVFTEASYILPSKLPLTCVGISGQYQKNQTGFDIDISGWTKNMSVYSKASLSYIHYFYEGKSSPYVGIGPVWLHLVYDKTSADGSSQEHVNQLLTYPNIMVGMKGRGDFITGNICIGTFLTTAFTEVVPYLRLGASF